jgi:acyl-coenzyme A thioesterase PaaI-like protein
MTDNQMTTRERIDAIRARYDHCFGCGTSNATGLQLDGFERNGSQVTVEYRPQSDHTGFADILHGGIVATALDEVMAWTAMLIEGVFVVTGTMELRYRKPADAGATFSLVGNLEERRGRRLMITAALYDGDTLVADASAMFLTVGQLDG